MLWSLDEGAAGPLQDQIAANVRRAIAGGDLVAGERLPPARELAVVLDVNANTVLAAYRRLRDEELLTFRRGRGVSVASGVARSAPVLHAARELMIVGRAHGYSTDELARLLVTMGNAK
jgi:GntR family transcriptional regulator